MGWFIMIGGLIFLFLSKYKQLSDEDINRAVSVQKKSVQGHVKQFARNNQEEIKTAAWNHREEIGSVAYDNRDAIASAAFDNRELLADQYMRNQNNQQPNF